MAIYSFPLMEERFISMAIDGALLVVSIWVSRGGEVAGWFEVRG